MKKRMKDMPLTAAERAVAELFGAGYGSHTIGTKLFKSPSTVSTYLTRIRVKMGMEAGTLEDLRVMLIRKKIAADLAYEGL